MTDVVPGWLSRVAVAAADLQPTQLSRLVPPADGSGRHAAVLIAVTSWQGQDCVVLLQRSGDLRSHAGQVAFPGGSAEPDDADIVATALREAYEEAGLRPADIDVLGSWPALWIPVSGFVVTPVLGWWRRPEQVRPDGSETLDAALVPLATLADPANRMTVTAPSGWRGPGFDVAGMFVWGFTAGLLDKLLVFGGWEQPWDRDARVEPAPLRPADVVDAEQLAAQLADEFAEELIQE